MVIRLANRCSRVSVLTAGPGVSGHCIAVVPGFIVHAAPKEIRTALEVNDAQIHQMLEQATALIVGNREAKVGLMGLAFKANSNSCQESLADFMAHGWRANSVTGTTFWSPSRRTY